MVAPILRDVSLTVPRSGAAGSQGAVQEAYVSCFTGRHATPCISIAFRAINTALFTWCGARESSALRTSSARH